jgi:hypothetical protein
LFGWLVEWVGRGGGKRKGVTIVAFLTPCAVCLYPCLGVWLLTSSLMMPSSSRMFPPFFTVCPSAS